MNQISSTGSPKIKPYPTNLGTVMALLQTQAGQNPGSIAITAPGQSGLTYGRLLEQVAYVVKSLNGLGIGRNDRVAIVLPNGPDMAVTFLGVACGATSAPLNPAYRESEFDFYLADLNAKAVIVKAGLDSPVRAVAKQRNIPLIELTPNPQIAGLFELSGRPAAAEPAFTQPEDVALVLHTSGTTSRPKIVPLTQANICASANHIKTTLQLTPQDCCLNIMPLFHIHGLMGATLSTIAAGASIVCTAGFNAADFFTWLDTFQPTWYTAVPTMHQAILAGSESNQQIVARSKLRFIRSSSASLPPKVMAELAQTFKAPIIESYGMTEASHQMTSNPLPPGQQKPGSVGVAAGPQVAIMDEAGQLLPAGETGEIVINGPNVTNGYENNPQANQSAFTNGWFRTGDEGYFDEAGYLFISGRIKEIINRGGEKVAPREVDEILLEYPGVKQAVTFAVSHPTLGEDVAAAVILEAGASVSEHELRKFTAARLADFKVPRRVIVVDEIPKGPTGKLQRLGEKLAPALKIAYRAPGTPLEEVMAGVWAETLGVEPVGVDDNFFELGGHSLLVTQAISTLYDLLQVKIPVHTFFETPVISKLAGKLRQEPATGANLEKSAQLLLELSELSDEEVDQMLGNMASQAD